VKYLSRYRLLAPATDATAAGAPGETSAAARAPEYVRAIAP
jgi:hypothetical protein